MAAAVGANLDTGLRPKCEFANYANVREAAEGSGLEREGEAGGGSGCSWVPSVVGPGRHTCPGQGHSLDDCQPSNNRVPGPGWPTQPRSLPAPQEPSSWLAPTRPDRCPQTGARVFSRACGSGGIAEERMGWEFRGVRFTANRQRWERPLPTPSLVPWSVTRWTPLGEPPRPRLASGAGARHLAPGKPHQGLCVQWDSTPAGAGAAGSPSPRPLTPIPYGHAMCERPWPVSLVWGHQEERGVSPSPTSVPGCPWEQEVAVSAAPFPVGGGLRIGSRLHRAGREMTEMNPRKAGVHVVAGGRFPKDPTGTTAPLSSAWRPSSLPPPGPGPPPGGQGLGWWLRPRWSRPWVSGSLQPPLTLACGAHCEVPRGLILDRRALWGAPPGRGQLGGTEEPKLPAR